MTGSKYYPNIRAYARYEIDGKTVLHVSPGYLEEPRIKVGDKVTFTAAMNDSPGIHDLDLLIEKSIMVVDHIRKMKGAMVDGKKGKGGHYVTVSLDIDSMPVSKKHIDGFIRKNY